MNHKALPYVYLCQEKNSPYFYIGYRFTNYLPSNEDFGKKYFTSNEYVRGNFDNFEHTIVAEFFTKEDAYAFESQLIKETRSDYQINYLKSKKIIGSFYSRPKTKIKVEEKLCALPGCGKLHTNWRLKCCCPSHSKQYAGQRSHQTKNARYEV
jgi:hypothetical protein